MAKIKTLAAACLALGLLTYAAAASAATPVTVGLGTAAPFAILAGTPDITNTGASIITGNVGIHPAAAVSGFPPGIIFGSISAGDAVALQAKSDLVLAYDDAAGRTPTEVVPGGTLGGRVLVGGVYNAGGVTLDLTGTLTLDGENNPDAVWIFQATSDLVTASSSHVNFINLAQPCNVFWQVTSSATLGSGSTFAGTILALTSITFDSNVTMSGRALARNGTATLINDRISRPTCAAAPVPTPAPTATPSPTPFPTPSPSATPVAPPSAIPTAVPTDVPVFNVPRIVLPAPTPNVTLPPTDAGLDGSGRGDQSTFGGVLVAFGGLLVLAAVVIAKRRPLRR